ncbi:hypothetical protein MLD38_008297 [Melastoma candidum]|uniref:Uncharacterized protein n=1 Tax=Melastoma candidum TaxID=119954 RepID=A0ACB9RTT6_9MYRT|nr:hypothetical protein MLD38_008297 [Melastoma candidum]
MYVTTDTEGKREDAAAAKREKNSKGTVRSPFRLLKLQITVFLPEPHHRAIFFSKALLGILTCSSPFERVRDELAFPLSC